MAESISPKIYKLMTEGNGSTFLKRFETRKDICLDALLLLTNDVSEMQRTPFYCVEMLVVIKQLFEI
jgi:hypothetical protein